MAKKIEIIQLNTESELIKEYKKYLKQIKILLLFLGFFLLITGSILHIFFINKTKIFFINLPLFIQFLMVLIVFFAILILSLVLFLPKKLSVLLENSDREFRSLINSLDLLIIELKPFLDNISDHPSSKEIKETIAVHKYFVDYILENKYDYPLIISFTKYFINIQEVVLGEILKEKNAEIKLLKSLFEKLKPFFSSNAIFKIFPMWHNIIEDKMDNNISKLSLGIESLQKMQDQFNIEISNIESKLKNLDNLVKNITTDNTANMENFFESFNKIIEKIYKDYENLQLNFNLISQNIETIDDLSKDISVIAFNIEIEASKMRESKVFTVLAKEVINFSNQLSEYYSTINNIILDIKKFLSSTNYNEEYIKKNVYSYLDKIELLCGEYDKAFNDLRLLNQQLIMQNKENQKIFLADVNDNLQTLQKLAICLEELEHRNKFFNSIIKTTQNDLENIFQIANINIEKEEKDFNQSLLENLKKMITTKDEIEFLKEVYKQILNKEFKENEVELENKYQNKDGKDEGIIIF